MARPRRPRARGALALFLLVLVAATAWIGARALLAQRHLTDARGQLAAARTALVDRDVEAARAAIAAAGDDTRQARALTGDPVWRVAGAVPGYGATARTTSGLAEAADRLAREVLPQALNAVEQLDPARLRTPDGAVDLDVVRAATPPVRASADVAEQVRADVADLPEGNVVAAVADARRELEEQLVELTDAVVGGATALEAAPALLGADRPRRYLVLVQQTGESRGTGGLIGGYVELLADGGRLSAVSSGSNDELRQGPVPVPDAVTPEYLSLYEGEGALSTWVNVNLSPDLPVVAQVVEARWQAQGGAPLDAVVALDALALSSVLTGSGPLELPGGRSLEPAQLPEFLAVEQYRDVPVTPDGLLARKDQLESVAALTAQRLTSGGGDTLSLLRGLSEAVTSGHLRVASDDPVLELALSGVDGSLPDGEAPLAYPVVFNSTGGKLDHFLDRSVRYVAEGCDGDRRRSSIAVTLTNQAPEGLPEYLTISATGAGRTSSRTNAVALQVYGTAGAQLVAATVDGRPVNVPGPEAVRLSEAAEAGLPVWFLRLDLPPGQPRTVVLELDEPVVLGEARVPEQPLSRPLATSVDVPVCS